MSLKKYLVRNLSPSNTTIKSAALQLSLTLDSNSQKEVFLTEAQYAYLKSVTKGFAFIDPLKSPPPADLENKKDTDLSTEENTEEAEKVEKEEKVEKTDTNEVFSKDLGALKAIKAVQSLEEKEVIEAFLEGEERVTVLEAGKTRIEAIA